MAHSGKCNGCSPKLVVKWIASVFSQEYAKRYRRPDSPGALLPGLSRLSFAVDKVLHQLLWLARQIGLAEYADAEVDGFR